MLPLDSPRWAELRHANGFASDIPELLASLRAGDDDAWPDLWLTLCPQEEIYTATFAAVPHVVDIARTRPLMDRVAFFLFVGTVAANELEPGQDVCPADLEGDFRAAIVASRRPLLELVTTGETATDSQLVVALLQLLAAVHGHERLGRDLRRSVDGHVQCADCRY